LTNQQKWVDAQSYLADAIMGIYQVDTSPENVDVEIEKEVLVWVGQQFDNFRVFFIVWVLYKHNFLEPFPTPSHTISWQVCPYMSFFLSFRSWVAKTHPNHLAKQLVSTRLTM